MTAEQLELYPDEPSSPLAGHARETPWRALVGAWTIHAQVCGRMSCACWLNTVPPGSSVRTCLVFSPSTTDATSPSSFTTWPASGMGSPGGFWTLDTSESPNGAVASSLSDVLETPGPQLHKYYLSPKARRGILLRASRRGRELPEPLEQA